VRRSLLDSQLPRPADVSARIEAVFVGDSGVRGPLGAKGLGEAPVVGVAAAIGNAIRDATGVRLRTIPFRPETLWRAMQASGEPHSANGIVTKQETCAPADERS
jgi:CO/xanthine dehydrogenase Mo-binding subunit